MENWETFRSFQEGVEHFKRLLQIDPQLVAYDLHPDYLSTRYAFNLPLPKVGVQHHFAHALSCMAEHGLKGEVLAVVMDGTGYGDDGTLWGCEFLRVSPKVYRRLGHLRYIPLPGGEKAIKEPWRMAAVYLERVFGAPERLDIPFIERLKERGWPLLREAVRAGVNSPLCCSAGRLFDAVSALLGVRERINYEGQAAIELEEIAAEGEEGEYPFLIVEEGGRLILDPDPTIRGIVGEIRRGVKKGVISARFHNTLAKATCKMVERLRISTGISEVVLSGGCFQNHLLLGRVVDLLTAADFKVYFHEKVPPNDGGISLGQAFYALHLLEGEDVLRGAG